MHLFVPALLGLTVIVLAAVAARRTGVAAPLLLVVFGIAVGMTPSLPSAEVAPEVILTGVLPPLLYASSVQMPVLELRRNMPMIVWLSVVMVVVTAVVIGAVVHLVFPAIPFALAVALGAVVSPTDAVAASSIGKRLGLPRRLMTILEGESLFNDAAALVTLRTAVAALAASFSFTEAVARFAWASVGGVLVGVLVGWAAIAVRTWLHDAVLATAVSLVVPWAAFFAAEEIHASGIIAVVVAGVISGHRGRTRLSALERSTEATVWSTVNFVLENAVFLVMGLEVAGLVAAARADGGFQQFVLLCGLVLALMLVLRTVGVAVPLLWQRLRPDRSTRVRERISMASERVREMQEQERIDARDVERWHIRLDQTTADLDFREREPITRRGGAVLAWAGMRGVVTLAAAQTIDLSVGTEPVPYRSTIVLAAFTVAVTTLIVFGGSLPWLIRRLKFATPSAGDRRTEVLALLQSLGESAVESLGPLSEQEVDGRPVSPEVAAAVRKRFAPMLIAHRGKATPAETDVLVSTLVVQRRYLAELRVALDREMVIGAYSHDALADAQELLDREEQRLLGPR